MTSGCKSNRTKDARVPARATYVNLHKWVESDPGDSGGRPPAGVVDSIFSRQLYWRSYTFSKRDTLNQRTEPCLNRVRDRERRKKEKKKKKKAAPAPAGRKKKRRVVARRVKELSCAVLCAMFHRLLSCTASVDVVDCKKQIC